MSRRGRRPPQRGITSPNLTPSQQDVRSWFSRCSAAWRGLPVDNPPDPTCDTRWGKNYWWQLKEDMGIKCSYYDLFMRTCLKFALAEQCLPPSMYVLTIDAQLTEIECFKVYDISFPDKCGEIYMIEGVGEFIPPSEWLSPKCGKEGTLKFEDANVARGCIDFSFKPEFRCDTFLWPDTNPFDIDQSNNVLISVEGGVPDFTWTVAGTGFWLDAAHSITSIVTSARSTTLYCDNTSCGSSIITVKDRCSNEVTGYVRCTTGQWVEKEGNMIDPTKFQGADCPDCPCHVYSGPAQGCEAPEESPVIIHGYQKWSFPYTWICCIWEENPGECPDIYDINYWRWPDSFSPYPPPGGPVDCAMKPDYPTTRSCIGTCNYKPCLGCLWFQYDYFEWEC